MPFTTVNKYIRWSTCNLISAFTREKVIHGNACDVMATMVFGYQGWLFDCSSYFLNSEVIQSMQFVFGSDSSTGYAQTIILKEIKNQIDGILRLVIQWDTFRNNYDVWLNHILPVISLRRVSIVPPLYKHGTLPTTLFSSNTYPYRGTCCCRWSYVTRLFYENTGTSLYYVRNNPDMCPHIW